MLTFCLIDIFPAQKWSWTSFTCLWGLPDIAHASLSLLPAWTIHCILGRGCALSSYSPVPCTWHSLTYPWHFVWNVCLFIYRAYSIFLQVSIQALCLPQSLLNSFSFFSLELFTTVFFPYAPKYFCYSTDIFLNLLSLFPSRSQVLSSIFLVFSCSKYTGTYWILILKEWKIHLKVSVPEVLYFHFLLTKSEIFLVVHWRQVFLSFHLTFINSTNILLCVHMYNGIFHCLTVFPSDFWGVFFVAMFWLSFHFIWDL